MPSSLCPICQDTLGGNDEAFTLTLPCGHEFCTSCAMKWADMSSTCAYCRQPVNVQDVVRGTIDKYIDNLSNGVTPLDVLEQLNAVNAVALCLTSEDASEICSILRLFPSNEIQSAGAIVVGNMKPRNVRLSHIVYFTGVALHTDDLRLITNALYVISANLEGIKYIGEEVVELIVQGYENVLSRRQEFDCSCIARDREFVKIATFLVHKLLTHSARYDIYTHMNKYNILSFIQNSAYYLEKDDIIDIIVDDAMKVVTELMTYTDVSSDRVAIINHVYNYLENQGLGRFVMKKG